MSRLIDAELTTKTIADWYNNFDDNRHIAEVVDSIPTVEAMPYVIEKSYAKEQILKMIKDNRIEDCNNDTKFGVNTGLDIAVRIVEQLLS